MSTHLSVVLDFLTELVSLGSGYSTVNTARSALSSFLVCCGKPVGQHFLVVRLLKGIFNTKPVIPKTGVIWDPKVLLDFLKQLSPVKFLSLKDLTIKVATLIWLLTGQRGQSVLLIDIRNLTLTKHCIKIRFGDKLKTTRPGFHQAEICLRAYAPNRGLCICTVLTEYLKRTKFLRGKCTQLLVTTQKPHLAAARDTISKWVKTGMKRAGVDLSVYTPHSLRSASTSAAARAGVTLDTLFKTAGWTNDSTFRKYYLKPVTKQAGFTVQELQGKKH